MDKKDVAETLKTKLKGNMRPDIEQALKDFDNKKSKPNKKELKSIEEILWDDETVFYIADTVIEIVADGKKKKKESLPGVCVLTSKRFIFHKNEYKFLGMGVGGDTTEAIALDRIDSVNALNTAFFCHVQFHAITKSYDIMCNDKKEMKKLHQVFEQAVRDYSTQKNAAPVDPVAQIKQLSELHDAGVISDEEFEAKKATLLSRI